MNLVHRCSSESTTNYYTLRHYMVRPAGPKVWSGQHPVFSKTNLICKFVMKNPHEQSPPPQLKLNQIIRTPTPIQFITMHSRSIRYIGMLAEEDQIISTISTNRTSLVILVELSLLLLFERGVSSLPRSLVTHWRKWPTQDSVIGLFNLDRI